MIITIFLYFLSILTTVLVVKFEIRDKSPFVFLWLIGYILIIFPVLIHDYPDYVIQTVFLFYVLSILTYLIFAIFLRWTFISNKRIIGIVDFQTQISKFDQVFIVFAVVTIILILIYNNLNIVSILYSGWLAKREMKGISSLAIIFLIASISPYIVACFYNRKWLYLTLIFFSVIIILLFFRSRAILGLVFLPIGYYLFYNVKKGRVLLIILGCIGFLFSFLIKIIRYQGSLENGLNTETITETLPNIIESEFSKGNGDLYVGNFFYKIVEDESKSPLYFAKFTIPNKFAGFLLLDRSSDKTIEYLLYDYYILPGISGSLHPTGFGVAYGDTGGFIGILYFIVLAFLRVVLHFFLNLLKDNKLIGFTMSFVLFFARGSVYNSLILLIVAFLFFIIYNKLISSFLKISNG